MDVAAIFLPLLASIIAGLFGRWIGDKGAQFVTVAGVCISAVLSLIIFNDVALHGNARVTELMTWIDSGALEVSWAIKIDTLTAIMLVVVTVVSSMVHIYSIGYMHHDRSIARFMSYLSLFTFMMLMLVTGDNLVQMFFGWEGVGVASYLLIGFWYEKPSASAASIKAFLVNRVGDFGFVLGIGAVFFLVGSVQYDAIFAAAPGLVGKSYSFLGMQVDALTCACLLLFIGAMGKSAQLLLHTWLPDAMEGPTPVSALIHAATMVTAGVFMTARLSPLFEYAPDALMIVTIIGAFTAIVAATIGMTQFDIKRVIAYSTMSQLGYMFFAAGVSAYSAAIFHLMTHAFFKALLFLGAGSVIHAMSDEQDMRRMGGIAKHIKATYALMWIGSLALAGVGIPGLYGFAGFYSKDLILEAAFADHSGVGYLAYGMGVLAAFITAFYSGRLLFMTFHGKPRADEHVMAHVHESPLVMLVPLGVLAFGALFAGIGAYEWFAGHHRGEFWGKALLVLAENDTIEGAHHVALWVKLLPLFVAVAGLISSWWFYVKRPHLPAAVVRHAGGLHTLFFHKYYFDELYDAVFVKNALRIGKFLWKRGDEQTIDGYGPDGVAALTGRIAQYAGRLQTGYVYHYAFAMVIGLAALVTWFVFLS